MVNYKRVLLASASPRRKELLKKVFSQFDTVPAGVDETVGTDIDAFEIPQLLAARKAKFVAESHPYDLVIGADTCVIFNGRVLGKPKDKDDAYRMLKLLSGNTHSVVTGCALALGDKSISFSCETKVTFYNVSDEQILDYIATGDPFDKAGSYGIQSYGYFLVKEISGDYNNVVGLPISALKRYSDVFLKLNT